MKKKLSKIFVFIFCLFFCFSCLSTPEPEQIAEPEIIPEPEQIPEQTEVAETDEIITQEEIAVVEEISEQPEVIEDKEITTQIEEVPEIEQISEQAEVNEHAETTESVAIMESEQKELPEEIGETIEIIEPDKVVESEEVIESEEVVQIEEVKEPVEVIEEIVQNEQNLYPENNEISEPNPVTQLVQSTQPVQNNELVQNEQTSVQIPENESNQDIELENTKTDEPVKISPSRTVKMDIRQYLDITYPGSGWIYLGEVTEPNETEKPYLLTYFGKRRNGEIDTSFTLRSSASGTTIVHFYKQDAITSSFIDDYLEVIISDTIASAGSRVSAPLYAEIVPPYQNEIPNPLDFVQKEQESVNNQDIQEKQIDVESKKIDKSNQATISTNQFATSQGKTAVKETVPVVTTDEPKIERKSELYIPDASVSEPIITDEVILFDESEPVLLSDDGTELLTKAQEAFYKKDFKTAAEVIEEFLKVANSQIDSGLYLKGQIYEAKSDIQNIRTAISAYKELVSDFPTSPFWQLAKNRQTYLNRFYFDIR